MNDLATYLLIDTALIDPPVKLWTRKHRPAWLVPLYERDALVVSPLLIDLAQAHAADAIGEVMALANAFRPQLHLSIIDSSLPLQELAGHLRRFIYFVNEQGEELTLRFADCLVLAALATVLTPEQWALFNSPIPSWKVHQRNGVLTQLPCAGVAPDAALPLLLSEQQVAALKDALAVEQLLANLRTMRPGHQFAATPLAEYEMARWSRDLYRSFGHTDNATLMLLARGAFDTRGKLLRMPEMHRVLAWDDIEAVREGIARCVKEQSPRSIS
ncbi:DUF4123 domain-containing protein [Pseudoduganella chitinolytica]|uniref:DUF4123 domain-containing protein n=1 Tax=Pseudoduganella chitinolytica TaxID=34070 RepID=A0ABY8BBC0_9BURK|nr:DUF4123 domain-containing protein [Pseudoduganella chitinolytica]WEF32286.1 DUF4123 domain-containing protein [Pseudoduganella chitinolytica]